MSKGAKQMKIFLSPKLKKFVEEKAETEKYSSTDEVFNHSLNLLKQRDQIREKPTDDLRQELKIGLRQIQEKKFVDVDQRYYLQTIAVELIERGSIEANYNAYQLLAK
jgi:Arc/MetJ-type ribon-helix-helix transcriptional regulator